ncbi:MAG: sulfite exporter TauE/SafE family protein [Acidobacteriota bacterium]
MFDFFTVILPISGVPVNILLLALLGVAVGVLGGFFGMGGAWMVTPALNIFGFPMPFAVGTDLCHMAGKSIISTRRHAKFGNVDMKLGLTMLAFDVVGIEIGARLVMLLEGHGLAGPVIRWVYVVFLALIGGLVFYDYFKKRTLERTGMASEGESAVRWHLTLHRINVPPIVTFDVAQVRCSMWLPALVGLLVGILAGFLGIGGGLIMMPALVYLIGAPTYVAVGTDLFTVMLSGFYGAFTYAMKGRVELLAVLFMLAGAAPGAQIGTIATKYIRGYGIRLMFGVTVICALVSVVLKQLDMGTSAAWLVMAAVTAMTMVVVYGMVRGAIQELRRPSEAADRP